MLQKNRGLPLRHVADEDLLRLADGELTCQRAAAVQAHLEACWDCRARADEIQTTIAGFVRAHHGELDPQLPPVAGPRALLRARLAELAIEQRNGWWDGGLQFRFSLPRLAIICLPVIAIVTGVLWLRPSSQRALKLASALFDSETTPNHLLTPGATRQVTTGEMCSAAREEVVADVSVSLREKVFQEYGIRNARPEDYEIDYLIAPRLGGTEDIRNLWPEPYWARVWNAHVKDALEERLHEMVCSGQLDLSTAQHDIATDWISAYKKYFHTSRPLPLSS